MKQVRLIRINYVQGYGFQSTEEMVNGYLANGWSVAAISGGANDGIVMLERPVSAAAEKATDVPTIKTEDLKI
ncbi:MAG: hypothetical protein V1742_05255 [Pseudomonadota bacterium]